MSLTSFVALPDVREQFRHEFPRPRHRGPTALQVQPRLETRYSGRIGTAFDYLLRFALERRYPQATTKPWVAENGLVLVRLLAGSSNSRAEGRAIRRAERFLSQAKKDYATYLDTGEVTDDLLESVWRLAYLDTFYRAPRHPRELLERKEVRLGDGDTELREMLRLAPLQSWKPDNLLALNPNFGTASHLVNGADADIVVDDTIIDIKTTKAKNAPRKAFNQILGYAALAELGGINGKPRRMQHFEFYMARYGLTHHYDRHEVINEERWPLFLEWFEQRAKQSSMPGNSQTPNSGVRLSVPPSKVEYASARGSPYTVGIGPHAVAVGDFTGNGVLDLVTADHGSGTVSVLLGNGNGTFKSATSYRVGAHPHSVAVGDFTGDGKLDIAVTDGYKNTVSVMLGNGNGTFRTATEYAVGSMPFAVVAGDFNGDGILDLAIANNGAGTISVLQGNGDGTFQPHKTYPTDGYPSSLAVGDLDGDGNVDLAVTNVDTGQVSILLGDGTGGFAVGPGSPHQVGSHPYSVAVGDFNADGKLDLATANSGDNTISVLLGTGAGRFTPAAGSPRHVGNHPYSVAVGDFNADGKLDLAVANYSHGTVSVLLRK